MSADDRPQSKFQQWLKRVTDFSDWNKTTWFYVAVFLVLVLVTLYLFYKLFTEPTFLFGIVVQYFVIPVQRMGAWGWILYILFMSFQSIAVPIPSELVLLSSGLVWGVFVGFILGMIGSFITGTLAYGISKKGGRPIVEKFIGKENIELVDYYIEKFGAPVIFLLRAFPFMAFDPVSYVSGLLKISYRKYITATMLGAVSRCLFYAWLGHLLVVEQGVNLVSLAEHPEMIDSFINMGAERFNIILFTIIGVLGSFFILYNFVLAPRMRAKRNQELQKRTQASVDSIKVSETNNNSPNSP